MVNLFKDIFESAIVFFQNGILGTHIQRPSLLKGHIEAASCKAFNAFICIVHAHCNTSTFELVYFMFNDLSVFTFKFYSKLSLARNNEISCAVLITKCMASNDNWTIPIRNKTWNVFNYNWLTKYSTIKNVSNGAIRALPHLFEVELLNTRFIWCNGGTFNSHPILFDGICSINGNLVIGFISVFYPQIVIFDIQFEIGKNQFILDEFPNNSGHFISIEFNHRVVYFYL